MVPINPATLLGKPVIQIVGDMLILGKHVRVIEEDGKVVKQSKNNGEFIDVKTMKGIVVEVHIPDSVQLLNEENR